MRHFSVVQWTDFVRGLAPARDAAAMSEHLAAGCKRCNRAADSLRRVDRFAKSEANHSPPGFAERSVKALFSLQQPERWSQLPRVRLRLADAPAQPAGIRNLAGSREDSTRRAHYESDEYSLNLQLDLPAGACQGTVVGQLLRNSGEAMTDTAAYLVCGGEVAAACFTGDLGDFEMEFGRQEPVELWLLVDGTETMAVTLDAGSPE